MLRNPRGIRDITEWYISTVTRPDYVHYIFQRQTEIAIENLKKLYAAVGDSVQAAFICGTDFGTQNSQFCSSEAFDDLYLPYYQKINGWIHDNTSWKTFKHSCGAVEPLLDNIIRAGFDIINPVQCSATGMDPEHLKRTYGKDLVFWGGGVDTQKTLPFGTPDEVRDEVRSRCEIFSKDGGFVFNAIHNVQADTPVENVAAMIEVIKEFS
nr:uroporphyrinogen decarboxylase family protein [Clostridia bacterium]